MEWYQELTAGIRIWSRGLMNPREVTSTTNEALVMGQCFWCCTAEVWVNLFIVCSYHNRTFKEFPIPTGWSHSRPWYSTVPS